MKRLKQFKNFYFFVAASLICLTSFAGCGKGDGKKSKSAGPLHYEAGVQKYEAGDYDGAMNFYQKAIQIDPNCDKAYLDLGILYEDYKGNLPKAMECYQKYLLIRPTGEKAEMVKGWLLKLAVTNPGTVEPTLTPVSKQVSATLSSVEGEMDGKKVQKQIQALQSQLEAAAQNEEQLRTNLKEKEAVEAKLKEAQKNIESLKETIKKLEQPPQKNSDEAILVKRETIKFEEEKIAFKQKYEAEMKSLRDELIRSKKDKEAALAQSQETKEKTEAKLAAVAGQTNLAMQQKGRTEEELGEFRSQLERMKGAFAKATEERARLEKMLASRDAEVKGLQANLTSMEKGRATSATFDRASYQRQIVLLQQKLKSVEEERNRYLLMAKQTHKEVTQAAQTQMVMRLPQSRNVPEPAETPALRPPAFSTAQPAKKEYELVTYHRVKRGETLMMIAGYDHIYGDRSKWKIIYEANKDNIDDPNVLVPGQILLVPR